MRGGDGGSRSRAGSGSKGREKRRGLNAVLLLHRDSCCGDAIAPRRRVHDESGASPLRDSLRISQNSPEPNCFSRDVFDPVLFGVVDEWGFGKCAWRAGIFPKLPIVSIATVNRPICKGKAPTVRGRVGGARRGRFRIAADRVRGNEVMKRLILSLLMGTIMASSSGCILKGLWCALRYRCDAPGTGYCGGVGPCGGLCDGGWCCGGWGCEPFPKVLPDCCDPCDRCGNWVGPEMYCNDCCGDCYDGCVDHGYVEHGPVIHEGGYSHHPGGCSSCNSHPPMELPSGGGGDPYYDPGPRRRPATSAPPREAEPLPSPPAAEGSESRHQRRRRMTASYRHY